MTTCVVTGAAGFLGAAVVAELESRDVEAISFDRRHGQNIMVDPLPAADHCIHLAGLLGTAELFNDVFGAIDVNIKGTIAVLRECAGKGMGYTGILMPDVFASIYTATKIAAQRFAEVWHANYGVPISHVRAFNAFGPGQKHGKGHPQKIIPYFATQAHLGRPLHIWGDGSQTVDLIHTSDLARMLVDACDFGNGEIFDGGTGQSFTVNEVARMVCTMAGSQSQLRHDPMRLGEIPTYIKAEGEGWDLLDWKPQFRRADLQATVDWYGR